MFRVAFRNRAFKRAFSAILQMDSSVASRKMCGFIAGPSPRTATNVGPHFSTVVAFQQKSQGPKKPKHVWNGGPEFRLVIDHRVQKSLKRSSLDNARGAPQSFCTHRVVPQLVPHSPHVLNLELESPSKLRWAVTWSFPFCIPLSVPGHFLFGPGAFLNFPFAWFSLFGRFPWYTLKGFPYAAQSRAKMAKSK